MGYLYLSRIDTTTNIYCSDLDVGGISKRQREVVFLEQTEVLTDGVKQLLTLRRFLQPTTHTDYY